MESEYIVCLGFLRNRARMYKRHYDWPPYIGRFGHKLRDTDLGIVRSYMLYCWDIPHFVYIRDGNLVACQCSWQHMNKPPACQLLDTVSSDHTAMDHMDWLWEDLLLIAAVPNQ